MPCPVPETLSAYQAEGLPPGEREATEAHLSDCQACREALLLMGDVQEIPSPPPLPQRELRRLQALGVPALRWRGRIAAAALLACAGAWVAKEQVQDPAHSPPVGAARAPAARVGFPLGPLGSPKAPTAWLAPGAELLLEAGARVTSLPARRLRAEAGTFWLEASGEPVTLEVGELTLNLAHCAIALRSWSPRSSASQGFLLKEALAEEASLSELFVLRGEAEARQGSGILRLGTGAKLLLSLRRCVQQAAGAEELQALARAREKALVGVPGLDLVPSERRVSGTGGSFRGGERNPSAYRWITVLKGRDPSTELELTVGTRGSWRQWVLGLAARPPVPREVVELTWDGERLSARLNGESLHSAGREELRTLRVAGQPGWALSVWGGAVTLERSKLQEMP